MNYVQVNVRCPTLGTRLGSAATAVYWHVGSKDNLIALAADQAWHEIALPGLTPAGWRAAATVMAAGLHAMLTRHPWLVQAFGSQVLFGTGKARHDDHTLAIYEAAGFTGEQADQAAATVFTFVLGNALGLAAAASLTRKLSRDGGNAEDLIRDHTAKASEIAAQFPRLRARLETAAAADYSAAPEGSFEFGLQAILDGLQAQLTARRMVPSEVNSPPGPPRPWPSTPTGPVPCTPSCVPATSAPLAMLAPSVWKPTAAGPSAVYWLSDDIGFSCSSLARHRKSAAGWHRGTSHLQ